MTRCVLHIGVEKTGSTSLQATLSKNRAKLRARGVLYPEALGERNHVKAYAYASEGPIDELKSTWGLDNPAAVELFRGQLAAQLAREVAAARPEIVCVSNEHCSSRLMARSEIERLAALVGAISDQVTVVLYLRGQGDALRSAYSTYVKTGGTGRFAPPGPDEIARKYNYEAIIGRWAAVFGEAAVEPRLFEREALIGGDVVADFIARLGLEPGEFSLEKEMNRSLGALGLEFLRVFNQTVPYAVDNAFNPARGNIQELVEQFTSDRPFAGDPAVTGAFEAALAPGNERVRERWFPGRLAPLFAPGGESAGSPQSAPETGAGADLGADLEAVMELMVRIWAAKQAQVLQLRNRITKLTVAR